MINAKRRAHFAPRASSNRKVIMKNRNFLYKIIFITIYLLAATVFASAQDEDEQPTRSINSLDFQTQRPATNVRKGAKSSSNPKATVAKQKRRKNIEVITNPGRRYELVKRVAAPRSGKPQTSRANPRKKTAVLKREEIGVTFWRLRPLKSFEEDDAPTFAVNTGDGIENWTAERVSSTTKFKANDRLRFTIESSRSGYLYIVSREFYTDGTTGRAELIFPTLKTSGKGNNRVVAGSLIDIPDARAAAPYFRVNPKRKDYAGEEVIVIISPTRLPSVKIGTEAVAVESEKIEKWVADWGTTVDIYDAADGEGVALTRTEAEAANTRALTQEEPLPQTRYRFKARTNEPVLMVVQIQAKKQ